ncbi:MAG TPA: hypothetical protein VG033_05705, partial [Candidatus Acidoferrales bacterium]|nr:hypothetical protein [Candidatus Acidoferrales bacterium]
MKKSVQVVTLIFVGGILLSAPRISAQGTQQAAPTLNPEKKQDKPADVTPLTLDNAPPPVNAEEDAA